MLYMTSDPDSSSSKGSTDVAHSTSLTNESNNVKKNPAATPISSTSTTNEYSFVRVHQRTKRALIIKMDQQMGGMVDVVEMLYYN